MSHTRSDTESTLVNNQGSNFSSASSETEVSSISSSKSRAYLKELECENANGTNNEHGSMGKRAWCPAASSASRSVCPALNAMANHGYIPRSGHEITFPKLFFGLRNCYNLTYALTLVLTLGGFILIGLWPLTWKGWKKIELREVGRKMGETIHERRGQVSVQLLSLIAVGVEHNASLIHPDVPRCESHLPSWKPLASLASTLFPNAGPMITEIDVAHARLARETASLNYQRSQTGKEAKSYTGLDAVHAEIARGEMAIILGVWRESEESPNGIPLASLMPWLTEERLPEDWVKADLNGKTRKRTGLFEVMKRSKTMKAEMDRIRALETI